VGDGQWTASPEAAGIPAWAKPCIAIRSDSTDSGGPSLLPLQPSRSAVSALGKHAGFVIARADLWAATPAIQLLQDVGADGLPPRCQWGMRLWEVSVSSDDGATVPGVDVAEEAWWAFSDAFQARKVWDAVAR